ncbi:MAG: aldo/keto reductase [Firmicutes bacterium]|uniref:Aldo/keto reductase n=1 Tax=Candidatus Gallilactobacillus intestinavium TaxID=2840838 RepID=A0A9D9E6K5_9LACO|nr:aldo/keto reductase [Candidatus Gallilactobacillus intestinavium]
MEYTILGNSEIKVSRICMGGMSFGDPANGQHTWTLNQDQTSEVIKTGLENGITFFDTAAAYQNGTSEIYMGKALNENVKRDDIVVATKFLPRTQYEIDQKITGQEHVENSLDASLKRLNMDYVDLYIYHMWDYRTPLEEIMEGLDNVVKKGKARAIGISNCYAYQMVKANDFARANGLTPLTSMQSQYNLIYREDEREIIPASMEEKIALTPYSGLAAGRLAKHYDETSKRLREDEYNRIKYASTKDQDRLVIDRVMELAEKREVTMSEISLAWLLSKTTAPLVGMTKKKHVALANKATNLKLSDEEIYFLEEPYVPHKLTGVMSQNRPDADPSTQVWMKTADQLEKIYH